MTDPDPTGDFQPRPADATVADGSPLPPHIGRYRVEKVLGEGGFGRVYLARDEQLLRPVAIKVPHANLVAHAADAEAYVAEARTVANLEHPHIVPVYDIGSSPAFPCFVVSKFIDGPSLAVRLKQSRLTLSEAVALVATVAEALHHAHKQGVVHRDVKPGNILLDRDGRPVVADFGLALREQDVGRGPRYAGTPAYMSPEQARGESHRVDGRSDIFSLGVVFYELLAGRTPFRADSREELLEQVSHHEPRPLRQLDDGIPKEVERICFKALAKRASERYMTAKDLADDLGRFLAEQAPAAESAVVAKPPSVVSSQAFEPTSVGANTPASAVKIVPKGLRSFDANDADFFLELLPGPRDRDGLPDSLRFWKTRIEETDAEKTFAVGLVCGPSGCGKSSLVKAGLLPRLSGHVTAVYLEASAEETEARLLNGLRKRCPALHPHMGLKETLAALRRGQGLPRGQKVVIVLDQFEQWLHAKKEEPNTDLVQALRQCDGERVQCVVMVRDDFWMAVIRFMRELEIRLLDGQNSAAVDLFDGDHARKVLTAFGRAFGRLAEGGETDREQKEFLKQAVAGLTQEGKVIPVRLALFAEMMKGKAWTPASLKAVGGTEGVGVTFLEETFSAATAPPEHRYHQKAARAVLKALLPESGSDIKGHMRAHGELLAASGYGHRLRDFDDLIRILDNEIRLITPTDPEGKQTDGDAVPTTAGQKYYQLTHDYLVHPIREWLTRKQKQTRRGRAELSLADRATVWTSHPDNRQLPSLLQWLSIRGLTTKRNWSAPEQTMMRRAGRYHAIRGAALTACLVALGLLGWEANGRLQARTLRDRLLEASTVEAPAVVKDMAPYRRWVDPLLQDAFKRAEEQKDARKQLHASLALLPVDAGQVDYLFEQMLTGDPAEVKVVRDVLADRKDGLTERLWTTLEDPRTDQDRRLRAACALAGYAPEDARWRAVGGDVAAVLMAQKPFVIAQWTDLLKRAGNWLVPPLAGFLVDESRSVSERGLIASVYGACAPDVPDAFARLEEPLTETSGPDATPEVRIALAKKHASLGAALLVMGKGERAWPLLKHSPDPTVRSYLISRLAAGGVDPKFLLARFGEEGDVSVRRAILLSLGEYGQDRVSQAERRNLFPRLEALYRDDPDPGVHAAAEWTLQQWGAYERVKAIDATLLTGKVEGQRQWYLNRQGQTMAVIPPPRGADARPRPIDRTFALATKEVSLDQFRRFREFHKFNSWYSRTGECPAINVLWYDAAAYCNWLSEKEDIPKDQWCYQPNREGKYAEGMTTAPDYLKRSGYRLPTEAEWEYACRAGAETDYSFGGSVELLGRYGWYDGTALGTSHAVGSRRPNDRGLFDMHGNVWEWCEDVYQPLPNEIDENPNAFRRVLRGGSFNNQPTLTRSANRNGFKPARQDDAVGVRPARTMIP